MIPITWQEEDNELFFLCNKTIQKVYLRQLGQEIVLFFFVNLFETVLFCTDSEEFPFFPSLLCQLLDQWLALLHFSKCFLQRNSSSQL